MANNARQRTRWGGHDSTETLQRMEGLLQHLRDTPPEHRPDQLTHVYLAAQLGTSARAMQQRLQDAHGRRSRDERADHFVDLWEQIANLLGEHIAATVYKTARDVSNRNSFNAAKWILERTDPDTYGTSPPPAEASAKTSIAEVPQEIFDELNDVEVQQLEEIEQAIVNAQVNLERLIRRVQKRVADRRANEVGHGDD